MKWTLAIHFSNAKNTISVVATFAFPDCSKRQSKAFTLELLVTAGNLLNSSSKFVSTVTSVSSKPASLQVVRSSLKDASLLHVMSVASSMSIQLACDCPENLFRGSQPEMADLNKQQFSCNWQERCVQILYLAFRLAFFCRFWMCFLTSCSVFTRKTSSILSFPCRKHNWQVSFCHFFDAALDHCARMVVQEIGRKTHMTGKNSPTVIG